MNRRQKIIVSVVGITIVLLALLGLTYAYYLTRIQGNTNTNSISITTANLKLVYNDGTGDIITSDSPIEPGKFSATKTFSVTNSGNSTIDDYAVVIENFSVVYASDSNLSDGTSVSEGDVTSLVYPEDMQLVITCESSVENKVCNGMDGYLPQTDDALFSNSIEVDETQTYTATLTYVDSGIDQSADMNKRINGKFNIMNTIDTIDITGTVASYEEGDYVQTNSTPKVSKIHNINGEYVYKILGLEVGTHRIRVFDKTGTTTKLDKTITIQKGEAASIVDNVITITDFSRTLRLDITGDDINITDIESTTLNPLINGSIAAKIVENAKNNSNGTTYNQLLTTPAQEVSLKNESTLGVTLDDLGTSYYFRGAVTNNYLQFNNMCWRIVRIEGDGAIKITLAGTGSCEETTTSSGMVTDSDGIAYYEIINNYELLSNNPLTTWLNDNFITNVQNTYLKNDTWCLGDSDDYKYDSNGNLIPTGGTYVDEDEDGYYMDLTYKVNGEYYTNVYTPTTKRLLGLGIDKYATFKCSSEENSFNSLIGMLTADEIVYAGGKYETSNKSFYLYDNAKRLNLTLSNYGFADFGYSVYLLGGAGNLGNIQKWISDSERNGSGNDKINIRPTITLKPAIKYISGNGTQSSPYVIK